MTTNANTERLAALSAGLTPLKARWSALGAREKRLVLFASAALLLFLTWVVGVQPALRTLSTVPAQRDALDVQWQGMQKLAAESRELSSAAPMSPADSLAALQAATARLGAAGKLSVQGERAVLTLSGASTGQLRDWLSEARSGARARPVEANLSRAAQGYTGTLIVAIGGAL